MKSDMGKIRELTRYKKDITAGIVNKDKEFCPPKRPIYSHR